MLRYFLLNKISNKAACVALVNSHCDFFCLFPSLLHTCTSTLQVISKTSTFREVAKELLPLVRVYKDGSIERLSLDQDPETGVSSKDITISHNTAKSARLYHPKLTQTQQKLPILAYFHGGGFCIDSAFSFLQHRYLNTLVSQSQVVAVAIEYRLAPEHPLPAACQVCWAALQWVTSNKIAEDTNKEPWLLKHGDFD